MQQLLSQAKVWRAAAPSLLLREDELVRQRRCPKIAAFDLNDTLVASKVGAPGYQVTLADWIPYNDRVIPKLRELHSEGFKLVIFTNQGNIRGAVEGKRAQAVKAYIDAFLQELATPVQVFAATQSDKFRKPQPGMWEYLEQKANAGVAVDRSASFYVGDAAGGLGEHSADDLNFAKALNVRFIHARDFFGPPSTSQAGTGTPGRADGQPPAKAPRLSGLGDSDANSDVRWQCRMNSGRLTPPVVLVLVGAPGSGKSTFAERLGPPAPAGPRASARASGGGLGGRDASTWRRVCQDLLGSKDACIRAAVSCLDAGLSVVIDRTNYNVEQRGPWLKLAAEKGADCHCLVLDVPASECIGRVARRHVHEGGLTGGGGRIVIMKLYSQLEPVTALEGFSHIRFLRNSADSEAELQRYHGDLLKAKATTSPCKDEATARAAATADEPQLTSHVQPATSTTSMLSACAAAPLENATPQESFASTVRKLPSADPAADVSQFHGTTLPEHHEKAERLAALGFQLDTCYAALVATGWDLNVAANQLLAERLSGDD